MTRFSASALMSAKPSQIGALTFRGRTLREALDQVRSVLGGDAWILRTRERRAWSWRSGTTHWVEVLARPSAADDPPRTPSQSSQFRTEDPAQATIQAREWIRARGGSEALCDRVIKSARELAPIVSRESRVRIALERTLRSFVAPGIAVTPGVPRVIGFAGAAGVGKSRIMAQLAAQFQCLQGRRVAFAALATDADTNIDRWSYPEELRTNTQMEIGFSKIPKVAVRDPAEFSSTLESLGPTDLILAELPATHPRDPDAFARAKQWLDRIRCDEAYAVIAPGLTAEGLQDTLAAHARIGANRVILTRLDESPGLGILFDILPASRPASALSGISYVSVRERSSPPTAASASVSVSVGIRRATSRGLARWFWEEQWDDADSPDYSDDSGREDFS